MLEDTDVCDMRNFSIVLPPINIIPFMDMKFPYISEECIAFFRVEEIFIRPIYRLIN